MLVEIIGNLTSTNNQHVHNRWSENRNVDEIEIIIFMEKTLLKTSNKVVFLGEYKYL